MAKASLKKPKLTPQEQLAELARLTSSVAAIRHVGPPVAPQHWPLAPEAPLASAAGPAAELPVAGVAQPDLTALFAASGEKKTFQVRITASHQQFFQQVGVLLGAGASSADIIHNILTAFRAANEGQIQAALLQQLRQPQLPAE